MSGIAGIIFFKPLDDAGTIVRTMSHAIQHCGYESLHEFVRPINSRQSALISVRAPTQNAFTVDSSPAHLHIITSSSHSDVHLRSDVLWNLDTFNILAIQIDSDGFRVFRSVDGTCGFYYAQVESAIIFASEKKSIWAISQNQVESLNPGHTFSVTWDGRWNILQLDGLSSPPIDKSIDRLTAIEILEKSLIASFRHLTCAHECAILFSGGVDSALAALLMKKYHRHALLITAVCDRSHDEVAATKAAKSMGSESIIVTIDGEALWNALPEVIYSIETSERMHVEIALPFFFAAMEAKQRGIHLMISGQGPDELFAGYAKHERLMKEEGSEAVEMALWNEVSETNEINIQRDVRAIAAHGLDVFFPYMYPSFIRAAMSLPAKFKVDPSNVPSRKIIFRELAEYMGLPNEIATAPKQATQYSSGTSKLLSATILERMEGVSKLSKRDKNALIQEVLDTIALHLKIPVKRERCSQKFDLKPTVRLLKRLKTSTPSN